MTTMVTYWYPDGEDHVFRVAWTHGAKSVALECNVTVDHPFLDDEWVEMSPMEAPVGSGEWTETDFVTLDQMHKFVTEKILPIDPQLWGALPAREL